MEVRSKILTPLETTGGFSIPLEGFRIQISFLGYLNPSSGNIDPQERYLNSSSGIINPQEGYLNPSSGIINPSGKIPESLQ